ncbi:helix-turn-helix domain-containing protein [Paenibacillus sp. LHD-117]|uniref:helix-turn-helix domain-containing protein n=1 Tax=Paenibacillus sp. LHD-117 TaxID=3071412 RepID=UPI0027E20B2C|nr:helix-turn-helix domain-containing protein [Paenibacillus sp. LHD-117]MDQ6423642.1 helix-turn-helix domain-containing protein [Paenibacillus sp. LHD-117]
MAEYHNDYAKIDSPTLPGLFICDHFDKLENYRVLRPRGTEDWQFTFTISGQGRFIVDSKTYPVREGDLTIIKPGTEHDYATMGERWEFIWAHFLPRPAWTEWLGFAETAKGFIRITIEQQWLRDRIVGCFQRMIRDNRGFEAYSGELSLNALEEALLAVNQWNRAQRMRETDSRIHQVLRIFGERMKEPHTLPSLAREVSLSPSRLSHLFREQVGDSVLGTLMSMRLRHAEKLLKFSDRPIAEIAADVGFMSPFYFTKQFRSFTGMSPSDYRKRVNEAVMEGNNSF